MAIGEALPRGRKREKGREKAKEETLPKVEKRKK